MTLEDNREDALKNTKEMALSHSQIEVKDDYVQDVEDERTVHYVDVIIRRDGNPHLMPFDRRMDDVNCIEVDEKNNLLVNFTYEVKAGEL